MKRRFEGKSRLHLSLNTRKFEESIKFYEALFDVEPSKVKPGYAKFEVHNPPVNLTLNEAKEVSGNRLNHLGVEVKMTGDVSQKNERLKKLGMETFLEESNICCYAKQDKVWVSDPDGNSWETFVVFEDAEEKGTSDFSVDCNNKESAAGSPCCS